MGLDLKGGTHLILQVQVNDAINSTSDRAVDLLKEEMAKRKINYTDLSKPDPTNSPDLIVIKGVSADQRSELEGVVSRPASGIRSQNGRRKFSDAQHEAAEHGRSEEPGGGAGDRNYPQPH